MVNILGIYGGALTTPVIPAATPSVMLAAMEASEPVASIRTDLTIQKLDTSFVEYAITQALDAQGINLARWLEMGDRTNSDISAPSFGLASLAKLYDAQDIAPIGATGNSGISAATPTATQDFAAATDTGTWTATTTGGVSGFQSEDASATLTYTIAVPAGGRITVESPTVFSQGAIAKVVVSTGGSEIAAANYATWLDGGDRVIDQKNPGGGLGVYTVAKDLSAGTYTVELSFPGGANPDTRRLFAQRVQAWNATAYDAVGAHGSVVANSDSGELSDRTFEPGTVLVYAMSNVDRLAWKYWATGAAGTVSFSVFDNTGSPVAVDLATLNMSGSGALSEVTIVDGLTVGDYYLHVELQNTDINSPRLYSHGAVAYNETAAGASTAPIDIQDMPLRPTGGFDIGTSIIGGPPALDAAMHVKRPADASYEWVGSVHGNITTEGGFETSVTNATLRTFVNGVEVDWVNASQFDDFRDVDEIRQEFTTFYQVPADTSQTFAEVTRTVRYLPGGIVKHRVQRTHTLEMEVDIDYTPNMLQVPNPNTGTSFADSVGGGFTSLEMSDSGSMVIGEYNGAGSDTTTFTDFNREAKFSNGTWEVVSSMDNPDYVAQQYAAHSATLGSRVLNYPSGFVKFYSEASSFTIPAGATFDIERTFRIAPAAPTAPIAQDPDYPWGQFKVIDDGAHQGVVANQATGDFYLVDNSYIRRYDSTGLLLVENADPESSIGTGSYQDPVIFNGELMFRTGFSYTFWDLDTLAFLRQFTGVVGGSTLCNGPDATKVYSFSYSAATSYKVVDPSDGTAVLDVPFTGETITNIQGSVWSERDQLFYVSSDTANTIHSVTVAGVVSPAIFTFPGGGFVEGLTEYQGQVYLQVYDGVNDGLYMLPRTGAGLDAQQGPISVINGAYFADGLPSSGSSALTVLPPPGDNSGNRMFLIVTTDGTHTITAPAGGWSEIASAQRGGTSGYSVKLFEKAGVASEANVTIADYGAQAAHMIAVSGHDDAVASVVTTLTPPAVSSDVYTMPEAVSTRENALALFFTVGSEDATRATLNTFSDPIFPEYRNARVIDSLTHPFGNGGTFGILAAEIPTAGQSDLMNICQHAFSEEFRTSFAVVVEAPA